MCAGEPGKGGRIRESEIGQGSRERPAAKNLGSEPKQILGGMALAICAPGDTKKSICSWLSMLVEL